MLIWLGGCASAPLDSIAIRIEALGHHVVGDDRTCDLRVWLDLGRGPRGPLPPGDPPLLVLTDRASAADIERLLGANDADWMRWPDDTSFLQLRLTRAARMRRRDDLLPAAIAHEINNPLTWLFANLDLLARSLRTEPELHALAHDAIEGAERIRSVVEGVRSLRAARESPASRVDLGAVVDASCRLIEGELRGRATLIRDELDRLPAVEADESRLGQVFVNLLKNALHALPDRPVTENLIRVTLRNRDDEVVVEVADNGVGMPPDVRSRIFEPFFTTRSGEGGTGLGLPISRGIVEAVGGRMEVESVPGLGSLFRVVLPARRQAEGVEGRKRAARAKRG